MAHGGMVYPDTTGNGQGETAEHLYTVSFTNEALWGVEDAEPNGAVCVDLWEPYITLSKVKEGVAA
jgi:nitrile hydratase